MSSVHGYIHLARDQHRSDSTIKHAVIRDPAPPVTSSAVSGILGRNGWYRSAVQVSLTATDNLNAVVGSFYPIDGGVIQTYGGPFGLSTPGGLHTIDVLEHRTRHH